MPRKPRPRPADLCRNWPTRPTADPVGERVRLFVEKLQLVIGERSLRTIEDLTGVDHASLASILAGQTWPDTLTLARLETGLNKALWPPMRRGTR
jgi:hypothetical protein